jgi:hypothetical protein
MKHKVYYHNADGFGGVEVQPPLPEDKLAELRAAFKNLLNPKTEPERPQNLRRVARFYCNGRSDQGTHFLAMPLRGEAFGNIVTVRHVATHVGSLLGEMGAEVTAIERRVDWDGALMGSRDEPPYAAAEAPTIAPASTPEI